MASLPDDQPARSAKRIRPDNSKIPRHNAFTVLMASGSQANIPSGKPMFKSRKAPSLQVFTPERSKSKSGPSKKSQMKAREKPAPAMLPPPVIDDEGDTSFVQQQPTEHSTLEFQHAQSDTEHSLATSILQQQSEDEDSPTVSQSMQEPTPMVLMDADPPFEAQEDVTMQVDEQIQDEKMETDLPVDGPTEAVGLVQEMVPSSTSLPRSPPSRSPSRQSIRYSKPRASSDSHPASGEKAPSSLSTLASALEKLKMPPPPRPSTSMGFNPDDDSDMSIKCKGPVQSKDDHSLLPKKFDRTIRRPLQKSATLGYNEFTSTVSHPRDLLTLSSTRKELRAGTGAVMGNGAGRGRLFHKVSRQPTLPSVMGSPVKGGTVLDEKEEVMEANELRPSVRFPSDGMELSELIVPSAQNNREATEAWRKNASRRASLASHALNQSLSALPAPPPANLQTCESEVAPPRREGLRSSSSHYPPSSAEPSASSQGSKPASSSKPAPPKPPTLRVLSDCKVFVDIKTAGGEDASDLFVDMLRGLGARLMKNVGQTCTHIVYRNGLMSTLNRYRSLVDPKPLVVGMSWVVACAEARERVEETEYLVDVTEINVAGTNKRPRKSMIPKFVHHQIAPQSGECLLKDEHSDDDIPMSEPTRSLLEESVLPLERARLRQPLTK